MYGTGKHRPATMNLHRFPANLANRRDPRSSGNVVQETLPWPSLSVRHTSRESALSTYLLAEASICDSLASADVESYVFICIILEAFVRASVRGLPPGIAQA